MLNVYKLAREKHDVFDIDLISSCHWWNITFGNTVLKIVRLFIPNITSLHKN